MPGFCSAITSPRDLETATTLAQGAGSVRGPRNGRGDNDDQALTRAPGAAGPIPAADSHPYGWASLLVSDGAGPITGR
jgi:hypothetical protein